MKHSFKRIFAILLAVCMLVTLLPVFSAFAEEKNEPGAADLWVRITALRDSVLKKDGGVTAGDFASKSGAVYDLVAASGTARAGSLAANGSFIHWVDEASGIPFCYSPSHEADKAGARNHGGEPVLISSSDDVQKALRGGNPASRNIGLIQPYWESESSYADYSFLDFSPDYLEQANALADVTGGNVIRYSMTNATPGTIAYTLENCGMVIFDSHGGTDWDGDGYGDLTSQANCSYIWLTSPYTFSSYSDAISALSGVLNSQDYSITHAGTYGSYEDVYFTSDGDYCVNGTVIANHMSGNAPHSLLYMGICLGMATDGMEAPLRAKGVEAVYGYSQSVTFNAEVEYMQAITNSLASGDSLAEAVAGAKETVGICDPYERSYPAYPIVASSEDVYPGHGNVDAPQTVNAEWRLLEPHTVTVSVTNPECGSASVDGYTITTTPADGYYPASVAVTEGTATVSVSGTVIHVYAETDCLVSVTFAPKPEVMLSFSGAEAEPFTGTADDEITLPGGVATQDGYEFLGWTESCVARTESRPKYFKPGDSYTLPYADSTLYALFKYIDHNGTPSVDRYVRIASNEDLEAGSYLIGVEDNYFWAFNGGLASPNVNDNFQTFSYSATNTIACTQDTDAFAVRIEPIGTTGNYAMKLQNGSGKYFGTTGNGTGINTRNSPAYPIAIEVNNDGAYIMNTEGSLELYFCFYYTNSNHKFAFYQADSNKYLPSLYKWVPGVDGTLYYTGTQVACDHAGTVPVVTPATCTENGYSTYLCANCGYRWVADEVPAAGHAYVDTVTAPTATEQGYTTHVCNNCGDTYVDTYVEPFGIEYQVTYSILGNARDPVTVNSVAGVILPTPEIVPDGYEFSGWSTSEIPEETTFASVLTGTYNPSGDVTLYAVYSRTETVAGNGDYVKVTSSAGLSNGKTLIVCEAGSIAFNASFGTSSTALNKANNYISVSISSGRIPTSTAVEAAAVTISHISGSNYSILLPCNKYLGSTGSSTGMNVNQTTVYANKITIGSYGTATIANTQGTAGKYNFLYNNASTSNRFAFYQPSGNNVYAVSLYQKYTGSTTVYYTTAPSTAGCEHESCSTDVTAPTCLEGGFSTFTCTNCGYTWTGDETAALGHDYDEGVVTPPTQEAFGYTTYTCQRPGCGDSYQADFTGLDYQITYSVLGTEGEPVTVNGYDGVTLPAEAAPVDNYTFMGWAEDVIDPETASASILTGLYKPTEDATLFAVYARNVDNSGTGEYTKVPSGGSVVSGGMYLIVCEANSTGFNAGSEGVTAKGNYFAVTFDGSTVADANDEDLDAAAVTAVPVTGTANLGLRLPNGRYMGTTGGTGISIRSSAYPLSVSIGDTTVIANTEGSEILNFRFNHASNSDKFGFYKATNTTCYNVSLYYKDGSGYITYYTTAPFICEHENATSVPTLPTCTEAGCVTWTCPDCNYTWTEAGEPATGHDFTGVSWTVNGDGTHTGICTACTAEITENCTYDENHVCTVCGYAEPSYDVTFSVAGVEATETVYGTIDIPKTASTIPGYVFMGWSVTEIAEETDEAPVFMIGKLTPVEDMTLYAVYVRREVTPDTGTGTGDYVKIYSTSDLTPGYYLAVYEENGYVYDGTIPEAVKGNYLTAAIESDTIASTLPIDNAALYIDHPDGAETYFMRNVNNRYLGNSGSGFGIYDSLTKVYENNITIDTETGLAEITNAPATSTGSYVNLFCYSDLSTSDRFSFYSTTNEHSRRIALFRKDGTGHHKTDYFTTAPVMTSALEIISAAPVLNGKIDLAFTAVIPDGYTNARMVFTGPNGSATVTDYAVSGGNAVFTYTGINPQCMGDIITATLYAAKDGTEEYVSVNDYSVRRYCVNLLADETISAALRTLLSDMLAYGAAAQTYMNYETNALVNTGEDIVNPTCSSFTALSGLGAAFEGEADADYKWISAGLTLTDSVAMTFRFYAVSTSGLTVYVGAQSFTGFAAVDGETDVYEVTLSGIAADAFAAPVAASFEVNGAPVGNTLTYSVNAYVCAKQAYSNGNLAALVQALYNYGASAAAYAG